MSMVKSIAENVMQSLKTLLAILLNQVATQVSEQEVPQDQAVMMNELLTEVQSQKEKIEELAFMMKQNMSPRKTEDGLVILSESDLEVWDQEVRVFQQPMPPPITSGRSSAATMRSQAPTTPQQKVKSSAAGKGSLPSPSTPTQWVASLVGPTAPGSPLRMNSQPIEDESTTHPQIQGQSLAWTATAMDQWGQKKVTWGKKHPGKTFALVYEVDSQYVQWCLSRINSLDAPIADFARYCQTRRQMEEQLHQSQGF